MSPTARDPTTSRLTEDSNWYIEVVKQARAGDKLAFDTLFEYYNTRICTYLAHIVGDKEEGRDLAQETFLKAWQGIGSIHLAAKKISKA
jgi:RNA polymerase sigma-70 factor, ECF subfamily